MKRKAESEAEKSFSFLSKLTETLSAERGKALLEQTNEAKKFGW